MSYVIIARAHECDDRYIGESKITRQLFWSNQKARAKKELSLEVMRTILYGILDDERACQITRLARLLGIDQYSNGRRIVLEIVHVLPSGKLGEVMDHHALHYVRKNSSCHDSPQLVPC